MKKLPRRESLLPLKLHWLQILLTLADNEQHGCGIIHGVLERTGNKVRLWPAALLSAESDRLEDLVRMVPSRRPNRKAEA